MKLRFGMLHSFTFPVPHAYNFVMYLSHAESQSFAGGSKGKGKDLDADADWVLVSTFILFWCQRQACSSFFCTIEINPTRIMHIAPWWSLIPTHCSEHLSKSTKLSPHLGLWLDVFLLSSVTVASVCWLQSLPHCRMHKRFAMVIQ